MLAADDCMRHSTDPSSSAPLPSTVEETEAPQGSTLPRESPGSPDDKPILPLRQPQCVHGSPEQGSQGQWRVKGTAGIMGTLAADIQCGPC